jgi:hypothetical protein
MKSPILFTHPGLAAEVAKMIDSPLVRYRITNDLWNTFTVEQVKKQIQRLRETGRLVIPNNGEPFTVRLDYHALMDQSFPGRIENEFGGPVDDDPNYQSYLDFHFCGFICINITSVLRERHRGVPLSRTQEMLDTEAAAIVDGEKIARGHDARKFDEIIRKTWREKDWFCFESQLHPKEVQEWMECGVAGLAAFVLVILLHDRATHKEIVEPRKSKLHKLGIGKPRPEYEDLPEVTLYVPRRVYEKLGGGRHKPGHHKPPRMHYRAEHVRQQVVGPRGAGQHKEIVIEGTWVNFDPAEAGTPIKRRTYKLSA